MTTTNGTSKNETNKMDQNPPIATHGCDLWNLSKWTSVSETSANFEDDWWQRKTQLLIEQSRAEQSRAEHVIERCSNTTLGANLFHDFWCHPTWCTHKCLPNLGPWSVAVVANHRTDTKVYKTSKGPGQTHLQTTVYLLQTCWGTYMYLWGW